MEILLGISIVTFGLSAGLMFRQSSRAALGRVALLRAHLESTLLRENQELSQQVELARQQRDEVQRQKAEQFERIDGIVKEANSWRQHYHEQSIAHGNAQSMMLETIERQAKVLTALGRATEVPGIIRTVMADFRQEHVEPAQAFLAQRPTAAEADLAGATSLRVTVGDLAGK